MKKEKQIKRGVAKVNPEIRQTDHTITIKIEHEAFQKLQCEAEKLRVSVSAVVRWAVNYYLDTGLSK